MLLRLLVIAACAAVTTGELVAVAAMWRHGDRAPDGLPYPADKNGEVNWPRGWNQLTNVGLQQTYELGGWLRERYGRVIGQTFDRHRVFVRSSDSERAIESAGAVAAALFPATGARVWNPSLHWQPTPIHTAGPGNDDPLCKPTSMKCPAYSSYVKEENRELVRRTTEEYAGLIPILQNYTGMEKVDYYTVSGLYDITREMAHGLPQPAWINETWNGKTILEHLKDIKRITRLAEFDGKEKSKYRGGFLVGDWLRRLGARADSDKEPSALLYSSHDGTLNALLYSLGVHNGLLVPYAACVAAELHREGQQWTVQLVYRNGTLPSSVHVLTVPGCAAQCPLHQLHSLLAPQAVPSHAALQQLCSAAASVSLLSLLLTLLFIRYI